MSLKYWFLIAYSITTTQAIAQGNGVEFFNPGNYLYEFAPNELKILQKGKTLNPNNYLFEIVDGAIRITDSCIWVDSVIFGKPFITMKEKNGKIIAQQAFSFHPRPTIGFFIDGYPPNYDVEKPWLMNRENIIALYENYRYPIKVRTKSFEVKVVIGNETRIFNCIGTGFPDSLKTFFSKLKAFSKIEISHVWIKQLETGQEDISTQRTDFQVNGYSTYLRDYCNLFFDYRKFPSDGVHEDPYEALLDSFPPYVWRETLTTFIESNCTSDPDSCSSSLFYIINGKKELALKYHFLGTDDERVELYNNNVQVAKMHFYKNTLVGPFSLNYPDGRKKEEGYYQMTGYVTDSIYQMNPTNYLYEKKFYQRPLTVKYGLWKFYSLDGTVEEKKFE